MRKSMAEIGLAALMLATADGQASAQDSVRTSSSLTAVTVGIPGAQGEVFYPLATIGMTFNGFRPDRFNPELALGTMPWVFGYGVTPVGVRLGLAVPVVFSQHVIVIPSAGASAAMVFGSEAEGAPGVYGGIAAVIGTGRTSAFRAGVTFHQLSEMTEPVWLLEIGVVRPFRKK